MEEFDELAPTPDLNGSLDMTHRGCDELDDVLWTMGKELIKLNCSFNKITHFPGELGDLRLLIELNAACNALSMVPREIGRLHSLTVLKLNGNRLEDLPNELCECCALEELVLSENRLNVLPRELGMLKKLRVLRLQSNKLRTIPYEIAALEELAEVNCDLNVELSEVIPFMLQADTEFIIWVCRCHFDHARRREEIARSIEVYGMHHEVVEAQRRRYAMALGQAEEARVELLHSISEQNNTCAGQAKRAVSGLCVVS